MEEEDTVEAGATLPQQPKVTVACLRCRDQKLKCDRELPSCLRCRKQRAACTYPSPPDRKRIAQRTSRAKASQSNSGEPIHRSESVPVTAKPAKRQRVSQDPQCKERPVPSLEVPEAAELPSTEIGLLLLEVYFKRIYNATLLFHKTIAFQLYRQNRIPHFLLRAIFAHAAIFLQDVDAKHQKHIKVFPVHTLFEKSWSWARSASVEALSHADEPTLVRIQALQVLQFYYFSQGEIQRAIVHASLAYRLNQLLGYDRLFEEYAPSLTNRGMQFDLEMRRRSFWASWCSFCIGSKPQDSWRVWQRVAGLPLPAKFDQGGSIQGVEFTQGQKMDLDWNSSSGSSLDQGATGEAFSLMAELAKLLGIWTRVQAFTSECPTLSNSQRTEDFKMIGNLLNHIERSMRLPLVDLCSRADSYEESPELLASAYSMYILCRILMHASMVPILSGHPAQSPASRESVLKDAEKVFEHALEFARLLQQLVAKDLDITRLWPFSGYAAFIVGNVFMMYKRMSPSSRSSDQSMKVPGPNSEETKTTQTVLEILSIYWKPLRRLAYKLNKAIEAGQSSDIGLINTPTYPWNTGRPGYSLEDHSDTMSVSDPSNTNVPLLRTPYVSCTSEGGQTVQDVANSPESYRTRPEKQVPSGARGGTENASQAPDSGYQSESFEDALTNSQDGWLFDAGWWNHTPSVDVWDFPMI